MGFEGPPATPPAAAMRLKQVHGARVVTAPFQGRPEADGALLTGPGRVWVGVADCLAVALVGPGGATLLHGGWRGLASGLLEEGSRSVGGAVEAAVSPHARACCYEFDPALAAASFPDAASALAGSEGSATLSLLRLVEARLPVAPDDLGGCTMCCDGWASRRNGDESHNWAWLEWS